MAERGPNNEWLPDPTELERITQLIAKGWTLRMVAKELECDVNTLRKRAADAIAEGRELDKVVTQGRIAQLQGQNENLHVALSAAKWRMSAIHGVSENHKVTLTDETNNDENDISAWLSGADDTTAAKKAALDALNANNQTKH